ncbi:hypothetical protein CSUI_007855, partial [Cystoisospora suis]
MHKKPQTRRREGAREITEDTSLLRRRPHKNSERGETGEWIEIRKDTSLSWKRRSAYINDFEIFFTPSFSGVHTRRAPLPFNIIISLLIFINSWSYGPPMDVRQDSFSFCSRCLFFPLLCLFLVCFPFSKDFDAQVHCVLSASLLFEPSFLIS